jgi:hypothetical protein
MNGDNNMIAQEPLFGETLPKDAEHLERLRIGPLHWFREWPNSEVLNARAGVYTVWSADGQLLYVGMWGRGLTHRVRTRATA